jgi:hypothetical protein
MFFRRQDPGPCPICGAPHTVCTGDAGPIEIPQLPQRDAAAAREIPALKAERVQATLPPGEFTSGTYRGRGKR